MTTRSDAITISASEFKARCLELMDEVRDSRKRITITKRGLPVAELVPIAVKRPFTYGSLPIAIKGDILSPIDEDWDADR